MSCVISDELYPDARKHLILLHQYPHGSYDVLLPHVQQGFVAVNHLHITRWKYSHWRQLFDTYFNRYHELRRLFRPGSAAAGCLIEAVSR